MFRSSGHNRRCVVSQHRCGANQRRPSVNNKPHARNHSRDQRRQLGRSRSNRSGSKSRRSLIVRRKTNQRRAVVRVKGLKSRNRFSHGSYG